MGDGRNVVVAVVDVVVVVVEGAEVVGGSVTGGVVIAGGGSIAAGAGDAEVGEEPGGTVVVGAAPSVSSPEPLQAAASVATMTPRTNSRCDFTERSVSTHRALEPELLDSHRRERGLTAATFTPVDRRRLAAEAAHNRCGRRVVWAGSRGSVTASRRGRCL